MSDAVMLDSGPGADLDDFLDKWRGRWPEWRIAQVFLSEPQCLPAEAWFALMQEWTDAAWSGSDPTPGFAKLAWWQDELRGWAKGARRHPLGRVLQKHPAPWTTLAANLPALQAVREPLRRGDAPERLLPALQMLADAMQDCERALFEETAAVAPGASNTDAFGLLALHALWHREDAGDAAQARIWAGQLAATPSPRAATRPRRIHDALCRGRLQRVSTGGDALLSPPAALWRSWRAARS